MLGWIYIKEGYRILTYSIKRKQNGFKQYSGTAQEICEQVVKDCWNGKYFMGSAGHFAEFWMRDFAFSLLGLLKLGYQDECKQSLEYCLNIYKKYNKITTTIDPSGFPFDFPKYGLESVAYLLRSLAILADQDLIEQNKNFLVSQVNNTYENYVDKASGLPKRDCHFSSMKDYVKRKQACIDVCFLAEISKWMAEFNLTNPLKQYDYFKLVMDYWAEEYFLDDLSGKKYIAADPNVIPFYLEIIKDNKMKETVVTSLRNYEFDQPLPLKYSLPAQDEISFYPVEILAPGYQKNTIWSQLGLIYIKVVKSINEKLAQKYLADYTKLIEKYKNFLEVFNSKMEPFKTYLYCCDESMLWAAMYLELV